MTKETVLDILDKRGPMALNGIGMELYRCEYTNLNEAAANARKSVFELVNEGKVTGVDTGTYDIAPRYEHE